jgi:sporulation protein YlmC with PRC-barrel domain
MLLIGSKLLGYPVLSLHVGGEIARTVEPIIDPEGLKIIGYTLDGKLIRNEVGDILDVSSVREFAPQGMIVDSIDEFVNVQDVVRMDKVMSLNFKLVGLKVTTEDGENLGKVSDYTLDTESFMIYQLIVRRPALKSLVDPELTINRSQIMEVDDYKVVVKNEKKKVSVKEATKDFKPNFVNPFREPQFSQIRSRNPDEPDTE